MNNGLHLPEEILQQHHDGTLNPDEAATASGHLAVCSQCAARVRDLGVLERVVRSLPLARAGDSLTGSVMRRIGRDPGSGVVFRILVYAPAVVGLTMVVAVMLTAFIMTGVVGFEPDSSWWAGPSDAVRQAGRLVEQGVSGVMQRIAGALPSMPSVQVILLSGVLAGILGLLALVDRTVGKKILQRAP